MRNGGMGEPFRRSMLQDAALGGGDAILHFLDEALDRLNALFGGGRTLLQDRAGDALDASDG